jgi:hypothetical protein
MFAAIRRAFVALAIHALAAREKSELLIETDRNCERQRT